MRKLTFLKIAAAILFFTSLASAVMMLLWNWLMPEIFGLTEITFWQAMGLLLLAKLIFGMNTGGTKSAPSWKKKWDKMPTESRERWKQQFTNKWCQQPEKTKKEDDSM